MPTLQRGDACISYDVNRVNRNGWLFFIHGAGSNHSVWKPILEHFKKHNWVAVDVRNHGNSKGGENTLDAIVEDIKEILTKEKIQSTTLIGNCLGTTVAVAFAERYPSLVKKLVLITPFSARYIRFSSLFYPLARWLSSFFSLFRWERTLKFQDYHKYQKRPLWYYPLLDIRGTSLEAYASYVAELFKYPLDLESTRIPALVITAEQDFFTRNDLIVEDCKQNKNINLKTVHCHHVPLTRTPEKIITLLEEFV